MLQPAEPPVGTVNLLSQPFLAVELAVLITDSASAPCVWLGVTVPVAVVSFCCQEAGGLRL